MAITFGGINTGLPPNIVDQLVEAERIPIKTEEAKKAKTQSKLKLVEELDTKVSAIKNSVGALAGTKGFTDIKLISGDPNIVQGVVEPGADAKGSWNIEVMDLAMRASAVTNGFPDKDKSEIGVGYFRFDTPQGSKDVYINGKSSTLEGAAKAINAAGVGVRATVINDRKDPDAPFRLMISGTNVGDDNKVNYPRLYFLDGDQDIYFDEERPAKNGRVKIDGYEMEIPDNTLKDVIPGVTLELKQASPGRTVNISVKEDQQVVSGKVDGFVKAMNEVLQFIQAQNKLSKDTDTSKTLGGDGMLRQVEMRLRQLIQGTQYGINGDIKTLTQLGIEFNRGGTLAFNQDKFNKVLATNPEAVAEFFAGDGFSTGFINQLKRELSTLTNPSFGTISNRKSGLQNQVEQQDKRIEQKQRMLDMKEKQLRRQFSNLEDKMSRLKAQGSALGAMSSVNLGGMSGAPAPSGGGGAAGGGGLGG